MFGKVFGVLFVLLLLALAIHYLRKRAPARFVERTLWTLNLDPEIKELMNTAWCVLKAFLLSMAGVDYQMERGKDC